MSGTEPESSIGIARPKQPKEVRGRPKKHPAPIGNQRSRSSWHQIKRQRRSRLKATRNSLIEVGVGGLEPPTSALSELRSNQLSYTPSFQRGESGRSSQFRSRARQGIGRFALRQDRILRNLFDFTAQLVERTVWTITPSVPARRVAIDFAPFPLTGVSRRGRPRVGRFTHDQLCVRDIVLRLPFAPSYRFCRGEVTNRSE